MATLSEIVLKCQKSGENWAAAEQAVSELVYGFARGRNGMAEEDCAEFLLMFYPRMKRLMQRYKPVGSSFEAYLRTTLRWQLRSFARAQTNRKIRLATAHQTGVAEHAHGGSVERYRDEQAAASATDPRRHRESVRADGRRVGSRQCSVSMDPRVRPADGGLSDGEAQRVLLLALKGCDLLDEDACNQLADELGIDRKWLLRIWSHLWSCCDEPRQRRTSARNARDTAWFQLRYAEALSARAASDEERARLERKMIYWRRAYDNATERLRHIHVAPTHKDIADALGVPKGTVDSSIFKARQELHDSKFLERLAGLFDRS